MTDYPHRGAKLGPRIAMVVSQAIVATHKALLGTKHKLAMMVFNSMSDQISTEVHSTLGVTLEKILASSSVDESMRPHIEFLARAHGQLNALAGASLSASSILSSVAQITNNALAPAVRDIIALTPQQALDPVTLAAIVARGIDTKADNEHDVAGQGYNDGQYNALIELAYTYPAIADALDMWRRGIIDDNGFNLYLARNGVPSSEWDKLAALLNIPLSPADAALAVLRGNMTQGDGEATALKSGVSQDDFATLIGNTGEPLGLEQLLEAYRRKFIDQATLERGIIQSRVRNEWVPVAEQLRYSPMSVADAVNAVVQNYFTSAQAEDIAEQNGLTPGQVNTLIQVAGEPLSRGEMFQLYNRGLASEADVIQAERESRLKNKYNDLALQLHIRLLEPRMLSTAVQYGSATAEYATQVAQEYGYSAKDAAIIVGEGTARKLETYKTKVVAAIETMYEDGVIDSGTATNVITGLGFTAEEANFIIEAADMKRSSKQMMQVISAVRTKYIGHHVVDSDVSQLLTSAGVPGPQIAYLLNNWQIELQAATRNLTEAQIVKASKDNLIPTTPQDSESWLAAIPAASRPDVAPLDAQSRLINMGYTQGDADLLLQGA